MRKLLLLAAVGGALTVSACATNGGYVGAGYGYDYAGPADDVWYDGYDGPYTDGYWGPDNFFDYRGGAGRLLREPAHHFRHQRFGGANRFHARPFDRDRDGDHDRR